MYKDSATTSVTICRLSRGLPAQIPLRPRRTSAGTQHAGHRQGLSVSSLSLMWDPQPFLHAASRCRADVVRPQTSDREALRSPGRHTWAHVPTARTPDLLGEANRIVSVGARQEPQGAKAGSCLSRSFL